MSEQQEQGTQEQGQGTDSTAHAAGAPPSNGPEPKSGERTFTQAEFESALKARLERERKAADDKLARERKAAEEKALEQQQEFKTLAEQRAARVAELESQDAQRTAEVERLAAANERMEKALKAQVDALRAQVPAHVAALLDKLDVAEQLEWLAANGEKLNGAAQVAPKPGVPPTPKPQTGQTDAQAEEARARFAAQYRDL